METTREAWQKTEKQPSQTGPWTTTAWLRCSFWFSETPEPERVCPWSADTTTTSINWPSSRLSNAMLLMHLAAASLALGSQWVSRVSTSYGNCMVKNLLGIPEPFEVYDMMVLGYAASPPQPRLMRDKEKMVHRDYCGPDSFRTDEKVDDFIKKSRALT